MNRTELVFYIQPDPDRFLPFDRYPRSLIRRLVHGKQMTGFRRRLDNLERGLRQMGVKFRVNDFRALDRNPDQCIGLLGKHFVLDTWHWHNPMVCGPAMLDHPKDRPDLFEKFNVKLYLVAGPWMMRMFEPYWGDRVQMWPIGIDTDLWQDFSNQPKTMDFLIYEKFLWEAEANRLRILQPILEELRSRGHSWELLRAGTHNEAVYLSKLRRARNMIFLCEHETQGQAYQEALSCNVPVLAWNQGFWLDPKARQYEKESVPSSSVPYFSPECGSTFQSVDEFRPALDEFLACRHQPREYIVKNLSLSESARRYIGFLQDDVAPPARSESDHVQSP